MDSLLRSLSAEQYQRWKAFYAKHPFGPVWDNYRSAVTAWAVANFTPLRGKNSKTVPLDAFLLDLTREAEKQMPPEQRLMGLAAMTGAEVIDLSRPVACDDAWHE